MASGYEQQTVHEGLYGFYFFLFLYARIIETTASNADGELVRVEYAGKERKRKKNTARATMTDVRTAGPR